MIRLYAGEPLAPGTVVCLDSMLRDGICSRPVIVVAEGRSTITIKATDSMEGDRARRRNKSRIKFVCDSIAEGEAAAECASLWMRSEQEITRKQNIEKHARRVAATQAILKGERP